MVSQTKTILYIKFWLFSTYFLLTATTPASVSLCNVNFELSKFVMLVSHILAFFNFTHMSEFSAKS
jgi:hypothetical protein